jgi:polar amino acid transport system substrate-binding protein
MIGGKKSRAVIAIVGFAVTIMAVASACGGSTSSTSSTSSASASPAVSKATEILGHAPTGLAKAIADRGYVVVADDANYPPQSILQKNGKLVGFDVDVAKKVASLLGLQVHFVNPAWDSIPTGLGVGRFDVSIGSMSPTPERMKSVDFANYYAYSDAVIVTRAGTPGLNTVAELAGKTIGTGAATSYYYWLQSHTKANVKSYTSSIDTWPDLQMRRLDGVMTALPSAQEVIAAGKPFQITGKPFLKEQVCFAIKKAEPDWLALLNYTVKQMHADGSLTAASKHWYNGVDITVPD